LPTWMQMRQCRWNLSLSNAWWSEMCLQWSLRSQKISRYNLENKITVKHKTSTIQQYELWMFCVLLRSLFWNGLYRPECPFSYKINWTRVYYQLTLIIILARAGTACSRQFKIVLCPINNVLETLMVKNVFGIYKNSSYPVPIQTIFSRKQAHSSYLVSFFLLRMQLWLQP